MRTTALALLLGGLMWIAQAEGQERPVPLPLPPYKSLWNPYRKTDDNPPLKVKVLVLNYDPLVRSENHRRLSEVFKWGSPERLVTRYKNELEFASGGYLTLEIVEWRNLNEIYAQRDGHRYTADEYAVIRRNGGPWHEGGGQDYPRLLAEQRVPAMIDAGTIDEVWVFGDHYFGLWEASMAGPGAFNINGGVYPEVPTRRPFAFYGFNYERGVAEMLHNTCHRTEATLNRFYGQWNLKDPKSNWDKFSANDVQSNGVAGVGTCHWPANATADYNYNNERTVQSWADDFLNYPQLTFAKKPISRTAWERGSPNFHIDYMAWYFAHIPRAAGVNADGRQNNWWKYMMDFQNYSTDGKPLPLSAQATVRDLYLPRSAEHRFTVAYSGATPVDVSSLDDNDLVVTGPANYRQAARLVGVSDRENGTHRVAMYAIAPPQEGWKATSGGTYHVALQDNQVRDTAGNALPGKEVASFQALSSKFQSLKPELERIAAPLGGRERIEMRGVDANGTTRDVTADAVWSTADPKIATVNSTGLVRGIGAGETTITATVGSLSQQIAVVVKDTGAPRAELGKGEFNADNKGAYEFSVTYSGNEAINTASLGFGDIWVKGPHGFQQFAEMLSVSSQQNPRVAIAKYAVAPPGGTWYATANGQYTIEVKAWQVRDMQDRFVADSRLGAFTLSAKTAPPADFKPPTTAEDEPLKRRVRPKNSGKKKT